MWNPAKTTCTITRLIRICRIFSSEPSECTQRSPGIPPERTSLHPGWRGLGHHRGQTACLISDAAYHCSRKHWFFAACCPVRRKCCGHYFLLRYWDSRSLEVNLSEEVACPGG